MLGLPSELWLLRVQVISPLGPQAQVRKGSSYVGKKSEWGAGVLGSPRARQALSRCWSRNPEGRVPAGSVPCVYTSFSWPCHLSLESSRAGASRAGVGVWLVSGWLQDGNQSSVQLRLLPPPCFGSKQVCAHSSQAEFGFLTTLLSLAF